MEFKYHRKVREKFPDLHVALGTIYNIIGPNIEEFEKKKSHVYTYLRNTYSLKTLKDLEIIRAYRDFFWALGIDPTKNRPAAEALIRRVLGGKEIPRINCVVDAYNLVSMEDAIALAAFDAKKLDGDLTMRFASEGEEFLGIGMKKTKILKGNELVISDRNQLIAIYPYRDADNTKVTKDTKEIIFLICGVPGIKEENLESTAKKMIFYTTQICGGHGESKIF
ncbi:MAG: B3/B4 domain-containing protein [Candidatus Helarchaeota archaeon]